MAPGVVYGLYGYPLHVHRVRHRAALEREKLRHGLHVHRKLGDQIIVLKVEVVVAVRRLGRTTRFDGIDLRGDLVVGTETGCG